jgi:hypothetical protein
MKIIIATILLSLATISAHASHNDENQSYSAEVGVQVIVRSVINEKFLNSEVTADLELALETSKAVLGKMECDRATGTDICSIQVFVKNDPSTVDAEETYYLLVVNIQKGVVTSARVEDFAG